MALAREHRWRMQVFWKQRGMAIDGLVTAMASARRRGACRRGTAAAVQLLACPWGMTAEIVVPLLGVELTVRRPPAASTR